MTTDLSRAIGLNDKFTWGRLIRVHHMADIQVVEYEDKEDMEIQYHPYIRENDTCHSFDTLEEAIVYAIGYKYDGMNSQAGKFFFKMIGKEVSSEYVSSGREI